MKTAPMCRTLDKRSAPIFYRLTEVTNGSILESFPNVVAMKTLKTLVKVPEVALLTRRLQTAITPEAHSLLRSASAHSEQTQGQIIDALIKSAFATESEAEIAA